MGKGIIILIFLVLLLFIVNYSYLDKKLQGYLILEKGDVVERVIDGDTIVVNGTSIRLLGINAPEKSGKYSTEAKEFLEERILNKSVIFNYGMGKKDKYRRVLAYVFYRGENINLELVLNGFANFYFPSGKDKYYNDFVDAWNECVDKNVNLCEKSSSQCGNCVKLDEFGKGGKVVLVNKCDFDCSLDGWTIKDEGRKIFGFPDFNLKSFSKVTIKTGEGVDSEDVLYWEGEEYVWTKTGDTLFLRDDEGKLVLWENY